MEKEIEQSILPEVEIYAIGSQDAKRFAPLLTQEAMELISRGEAAGLAVVEENEVRGAICIRFSSEEESVMELCSLYVVPAFRRRALGGTLLMEALERGMEATDGLSLRVECRFSSSEEGLAAFLEKAGFQFLTVEDSALWRFTLGQAAEQEFFQKKNQAAAAAIPLGSLSPLQLRSLVQTLEKNEVSYLSLEGLSRAHQEISYVLVNPKDSCKFHACAVWTENLKGELCLTQFFCVPTDAGAPAVVLKASLQAMMARFAPETVLTVPTLTLSSASLVSRITGVEAPQESLRLAVLKL